MIVVDASVAVKWFIPESGEEAAGELLDGNERLVAPSLIRMEVSGAIIRRFREGDLTEKSAREGTQAWNAMFDRGVVQLLPDFDVFDDAIQMAFLARHTLADCLYLAVAKRVDATVITADEPMQKRGVLAYNRITLLPGTGKN